MSSTMTAGTANMELSRQWMSRPDDERFLDLDELYTATRRRADASQYDPISNGLIDVTPTGDDESGLMLQLSGMAQAPLIDASLTHWSFGQLCQRAKVPAAWAREHTHPVIAADALNYGLQVKNAREDVGLYSYVSDDGLQVRAATSTTYGRIYDHQVVRAVQTVNADGYWTIPKPTFFLKGAAGEAQVAVESERRKSTLYASDRDVWLFLTDQQRPIEVPRPGGGVEELYRGFYVWNSEVGAATFGIAWFLYRACCENRILWGTQDMRELRIRHTSGGPERFEREGRKVLSSYAASSDADTVSTIRKAMEKRIGSNDDEVAAWLKRRRFTTSKARAIIRRAREEEGKCDTVWDVTNGATALARGLAHTDDRVKAEREGSRLLNYAN